VVRINCVTQAQPKPAAARKQGQGRPGTSAATGVSFTAGGETAAASGMTKAELVRKKLEAKAKEREAAAASRRPISVASVPRRRVATGAGVESGANDAGPSADKPARDALADGAGDARDATTAQTSSLL
jgi:hypothetical protein